jgi:hypothetical protein
VLCSGSGQEPRVWHAKAASVQGTTAREGGQTQNSAGMHATRFSHAGREQKTTTHLRVLAFLRPADQEGLLEVRVRVVPAQGMVQQADRIKAAWSELRTRHNIDHESTTGELKRVSESGEPTEEEARKQA